MLGGAGVEPNKQRHTDRRNTRNHANILQGSEHKDTSRYKLIKLSYDKKYPLRKNAVQEQSQSLEHEMIIRAGCTTPRYTLTKACLLVEEGTTVDLGFSFSDLVNNTLWCTYASFVQRFPIDSVEERVCFDFSGTTLCTETLRRVTL